MIQVMLKLILKMVQVAHLYGIHLCLQQEKSRKAQAGTYSVYDVTPDVKRTRGSYSTDAIAITEKSEDPERAALVWII